MNEVTRAESEFSRLSLSERRRSVESLMRQHMVENVHYGVIPGTKQRSLWQPGAQFLCSFFGLTVAYRDVHRMLDDDGELSFMTTCVVSSRGEAIAEGMGYCSTLEEKYAWRGIKSVAEWENTPDERRRINYTRNGEQRQVRQLPQTQANTVMQMSAKRAHVAATRLATACGDLFTQDEESFTDSGGQGAKPDPSKETRTPQRKTAPAADGGPPKATPAQQKFIAGYASAAGVPLPDVLDFAKIDTLENLPKADVNRVRDHIEQVSGVAPRGAS
jgi:hypothetical protein